MKIEAKARLEASYSGSEVAQLWTVLNRVCFDSALTRPFFSIESQADMANRVNDFVHDYGLDPSQNKHGNQTLGFTLWDFKADKAAIVISKDVKDAHTLIVTMAHEMVHQALAETYGFVEMCKMGHGPKFVAYKSKVERYKGLYLTNDRFERI
jgi:hypothetical protein